MFGIDGSHARSTGDDRTALVRRASGGDQAAFEELMRAIGDRLLATARKILRDPDAAEDAVQQSVILAWRLLPRVRDPERFDGWLYKILVSCCYAEARRSRRFAGRVADLSDEPSAGDDADQRAERDLIERAFRALTPPHRAIVVLHYYVGLPLTEVASIVGVRPGTVRSRLHYALRALRAAVEAADRPTITEVRR
jgi:RNA polymerase sigma-70 factor (ECF subfamily)